MDEKKVLVLLKRMLANKSYFRSGMCAWSSSLCDNDIYSFKEDKLMHDYIRTHRPSKFSSIKAWKQRDSGFYWPMYELAPRVKWIERHIKKLERKWPSI